MLIAAVALWLWPSSAIHLLAFTILLGTGHMFLMAAQQMLCVRSASEQGGSRLRALHGGGVDHQGSDLSWLAGSAAGDGAATGPLFMVGVITAARLRGRRARDPAGAAKPRAATTPQCRSANCCGGPACQPF